MSRGPNSPHDRKVQLAFGSALAILLLLGAISYRGMVLSVESARWVRHTHEVLDDVQELPFALQSIESSSRGFALTGEESYLRSQRATVSSVHRLAARIRGLTAANPAANRHLPALEELAAQKIQFAEIVIGLRRAKGLEAAADAVRSGRGERIMGEFEAVVLQLREEELRLLAQRNAEADRRLGQTRAILILGSVLALSITAVAGRSVQRDRSRRGIAEAALRDSQGKAIRAAEALRQSEERYRGLLEAAPDAMVVVDESGTIVLLNLQAEKQFGYHRDELVGQKVKSIIPEGFAERLIADGTRTAVEALAQQIGTGIELIGRRKDGTAFPIEIMLSPLKSAEGILVTAAIRDISTIRSKAEGRLLETVEELKRSNEELSQFAYLASHDLQEPLRMVASYTQLLSRRYKGKLDADADEFIAFAVDGATRMQRLIQDLLEYSRIGTKGSVLLNTSSEAALQQALTNLQGAIKEGGALVTHDPLPPVLADGNQLTQLFQNLVGNAVKYQGPGVPRVHISAARDGAKRWSFSVRDNGLGIEPQYFERIFGMFQRLHKRDQFGGTGIGLAICKKIVERHGGRISVESQPGKGSTFRFALAGARSQS